jgi:hypothetical protein
MAAIPVPRAHGTSGSLAARLKGNPAYQASWLLRTGFTVAPILFGLDKFSHPLVNWCRYLAPASTISSHSASQCRRGRCGLVHGTPTRASLTS